MKRGSSGLVQALAFSAAVFIYIWLLRDGAGWTIWLLVAWACVAFVWNGETLDSAGLSPRRAIESFIAWRYVWPALLLALALVLQGRLLEPELLARGLAYLLWCFIQQAVYQVLAYRRIRASFGATPSAWILSGCIFGLVHLPNPVLAPATALWGGLSSYLFERRASILTLAMVQVALSSLLYELSPYELHRGFRVGPGYFR